MGSKLNPGRFDCYHAAEPDEPMFVLLARDPDAPELVRLWAERRMARSRRAFRDDPAPVPQADKIAEAQACARAMEAWRKVNRSEE